MTREQMLESLEHIPELLRKSAEMVRELGNQVNFLAKVAERSKVAAVLQESGIATTEREAEAFIQKLSSMDPVSALRTVLAPRMPLGESDGQAPASTQRPANDAEYMRREFNDMLGL